MPNSHANFLRMARERRNLTQQQLANLADVSRWQVVKMEKGKNITLDFLKKVAAVLDLTDIPVDFLTLRKPDTPALMMAAEAIELARSAVNRAREARADLDRASADLDRAAGLVDGVLTRPEVPAAARGRVASAAKRLAAVPRDGAADAGRALRAAAESPGDRVRRSTPISADRQTARRRAR